LKQLFITFFQNFYSIIANLAKENELKKMQLQKLPIMVENIYRN